MFVHSLHQITSEANKKVDPRTKDLERYISKNYSGLNKNRENLSPRTDQSEIKDATLHGENNKDIEIETLPIKAWFRAFLQVLRWSTRINEGLLCPT